MKTFRQIWYESRGIGNSGCGTPLFATIVIGILILFSSCATKTQIEYRDRDVVRYVTKVEKDTVVHNTRDSVYYEVIQKGDTVFATKYKEHRIYLDKIKVRTDTCYRDSIVTEYKQSVKEVTKIPKFCYFSIVFSIIVIIFAFYKIIRWLRIN